MQPVTVEDVLDLARRADFAGQGETALVLYEAAAQLTFVNLSEDDLRRAITPGDKAAARADRTMLFDFLRP